MDNRAADQVVTGFLQEIHRAFEEGASIAKAARVCAEEGNVKAAVNLAVAFEDLTFRPQQMLKAILLIRHELLNEVTH